MEVSVIGKSQVIIGKTDQNLRDLGFLNQRIFPKTRVCFGQSKSFDASISNYGSGFTLRALQNDAVRVVEEDNSTPCPSLKSVDGVRLFVGLPLDTVSVSNCVNHKKAITAGLKALKLMGVDGIELPVWWGIVEKDAMGQYDWSGYLAVAEMVQKVGLKLHLSLCFHASQEVNIPLPQWVCRAGEAESSIYFTDRSGKQYKDCLSLAVDDLPVFYGKSPVQVYGDFFESFKSTFASFMGSTISGITVGLGPDGELRYPSFHDTSNHNPSGVGEFQCYDKYILENLKNHANETGNPLWGLGGPHDVPSYDEPPFTNTFFKDDCGSWETTYGDFFLSWYSNQLISHGNRILSLASTVFEGTPVKVSGKLPLVHSWYNTRSHPSELTAGFYNTVNRDGYERVVEVFAKNSCRVLLPGMDLSDSDGSNKSNSRSLLSQIKKLCRTQGVGIYGENSRLSSASNGFEEIKGNLSEDSDMVDLFMYQRMGAEFFSPKHFPLFTQFVRALNQLDVDVDDMPEASRATEPLLVSSEALGVQAA